MNAGYLSLLLIVVSLILFASGWKDVILRGITHSSLLLFFVSWLLSCLWVSEWNGLRIYGTAPLLLAVSLVLLSGAFGAMLRFHAVSVGLLLGSVFFFLRETIHLMPSIIVYSSNVTVAFVLAVLAAATIRQPGIQIAAVSLGLLIGEGMYAYSHHDQVPLSIGGAGFQDLWWLTVFAVRGFSIVLHAMAMGCKRAAVYAWESIRRRRQ